MNPFPLPKDANDVYKSLYCPQVITVAETPCSSVRRPSYGPRRIANDFVLLIAANPDAGDVIPDTGGLRKVRWCRPGTGKRGGVRIIYFYHDNTMPVYLLLIYAKTVRENWTNDEKRRAEAITKSIKQHYRRH